MLTPSPIPDQSLCRPAGLGAYAGFKHERKLNFRPSCAMDRPRGGSWQGDEGSEARISSVPRSAELGSGRARILCPGECSAASDFRGQRAAGTSAGEGSPVSAPSTPSAQASSAGAERRTRFGEGRWRRTPRVGPVAAACRSDNPRRFFASWPGAAGLARFRTNRPGRAAGERTDRARPAGGNALVWVRYRAIGGTARDSMAVQDRDLRTRPALLPRCTQRPDADPALQIAGGRC